MSVLAALAVLLVPHAGGPFHAALASAYSPADSPGTLACGGRLGWGSMVVAHRWLPCGTMLQVCHRRRCATATVKDRGPYTGGRDLDLAPGVYTALGFPSARAFGVRPVRWRRA